MYFVVYLSDTIETPADCEARGIREVVRFPRHTKLRMHIMNGKIFDSESQADRDEFNRDFENVARGTNTVFHPVVWILTDAQCAMIGLGPQTPPTALASAVVGEAPEQATPILPNQTDAVTPPGAIVPPEEKAPPLPLATPRAKKRAQELGIDISEIKGTGHGGIITQDDVAAAWRAGAGEATPPSQGGAGNLNLSQLLATATP